MLTLQQLKDMPPESIFATGIAMDTEDGLFMANTGKELRWVAQRGGYWDWAIYVHFSEHDEDYISRCGDKVHSDNNIKMLVPCDEEAFRMYRH